MATGGFLYHVNFQYIKTATGLVYGEVETAYVFATAVADKAALIAILANNHSKPVSTITVTNFNIVNNAVES